MKQVLVEASPNAPIASNHQHPLSSTTSQRNAHNEDTSSSTTTPLGTPPADSDNEGESSSSDWEWDEIAIESSISLVTGDVTADLPRLPSRAVVEPKRVSTIELQSQNQRRIPPRSRLPRQENATNSHNKPLKTIEKLQHMLDETDYLTTTSGIGGSREELHEPEGLWTSKDRRKYKKQQRRTQSQTTSASNPHNQQQQQPQVVFPYTEDPHRLEEYQTYKRREQQQRRQQDFQRSQTTATASSKERRKPAQSSFESDTEEQSDTDDGMGYSLPNYPVYLSDAEGGESEPDMIESSQLEGRSRQRTGSSSSQQQHYYGSSDPGGPPPAKEYTPEVPPSNYGPRQERPSGYAPPPPNNQGYYYGPPQYYHDPRRAGQQQQQTSFHPQYGWQQRPPTTHPQFHPRGQFPRTSAQTSNHYGGNGRGYLSPRPPLPNHPHPQQMQHPYPPPIGTVIVNDPNTQGLVVAAPPAAIETTTRRRRNQLGVLSALRISMCLMLSSLLCYAAVSPRNIPFVEYNEKFYAILRTVSLTLVPPLAGAALVVDVAHNDINQLVGTFAHTFTVGYLLTFLAEVLSTTMVRLAVFCWWEHDVFSLTPRVPLLVIPWVLREEKHRIKPITLLVQDMLSSALFCPIIEEFLKLKLLQWTIRLPKNFDWVWKPSKNSNSGNTDTKKKGKWVAEPVVRANPDEPEVTNVNQYVSSMLMVSLGLKLADSIRRICMYTRTSDTDKGFYAVCRGFFPIQELCGTMTALSLARRDVLGQRMPLWKMLLPAIVIHAMANFRGMKPLFKWNSAAPWSEMQLSPRFALEGISSSELAAKLLPKLLWVVILCRVTGYCVKNYYMINRQAIKRITTYAGNPAAFSAELAATEMLKGTKKLQDKS